MRASSWKVIVGILFTAFTYGCGGASGSGGGNPTANPGVTGPATDVTVTFTQGVGPNSTVAVQAGTGAFQTFILQSNKLTFTVPSGPQKYVLVYSCSVAGGLETNHGLTTYVIEATTQDGAAYTVSCFDPVVTGLATASVDASAIQGATSVEFSGSLNSFDISTTISGPFSTELASGTADVAAVLFASQRAAALKILRAQTVPAPLASPVALNGGNPIVFTTADQFIATQPLAVNNIPAGSTLNTLVTYVTATGTQAVLPFDSSSYQPVPASASQGGDFYLVSSGTFATSTPPFFTSGVGIRKTTTTAGPITLTLPSPATFPAPVFSSGPFPTFSFNFTGFNGQPAVSQTAHVAWSVGGISADSVDVTATASFQNGANTVNVNIPELVTLGIVRPPQTGAGVNWTARVSGGSVHDFAFVPQAPGNGALSNVNLSFVQGSGFYTQP